MPRTSTAQPQTSLYETTIENPDLEAKLEERLTLKDAASSAARAYRDMSDIVKAMVDTLDIADGPVRVGRFVISQRPVAGRSVSFETEPTTRLKISLLDEDE